MKDENVQNEKDTRMKFYSHLRKVNKEKLSESFLQLPANFVDPRILGVGVDTDSPDINSAKKNSSFTTILSVWNTMMGSGLVSMPWAVSEAGIIPAIFLYTVYFLICYYTAYITMKTGIFDNDFSETVAKYFGPKYGQFGRVTQIFFFLMNTIGVIFVYFTIIKLFTNQSKPVSCNVVGLLKIWLPRGRYQYYGTSSRHFLQLLFGLLGHAHRLSTHFLQGYKDLN